MKRDLDLIREILLDIEKVPAGDCWDSEGFASSHNRSDVLFTLRIMEQHEFISSCTCDYVGGIDFCNCRVDILPTGYDFIDASRNDTIWNKFKERLKKESPAFTLKIAIALLFKMAKENLLG